jgi:hypothetical protein
MTEEEKKTQMEETNELLKRSIKKLERANALIDYTSGDSDVHRLPIVEFRLPIGDGPPELIAISLEEASADTGAAFMDMLGHASADWWKHIQDINDRTSELLTLSQHAVTTE